jgi:hypothetical protein
VWADASVLVVLLLILYGQLNRGRQEREGRREREKER